jgi:hypothetical protein
MKPFVEMFPFLSMPPPLRPSRPHNAIKSAHLLQKNNADNGTAQVCLTPSPDTGHNERDRLEL